ncbi:ABC transporter permease [Mucilaginibacter sp. L3T2-6]|uniref:ABC transporter permease n=1 Tax=Mucilaginibacter sp. L3T2-6 TaxID=3062491 RepID=UPI00267507F5|nr:ABC transporter permease [Mucilaginibacter sp. L3T2-6]MDO3640485.1 ABC transporter permease [Mucilaginibacter sp. L3T2-6]MDV6213176.1 FtsX-like permease family protein [Mucilaginibacter sp. L3T2-6]
MLKNYFKTSFKYFLNNKAFSVINIIGLSTGICVCFFALLYVQFEMSRDSYNTQADNIYRLVTDVHTPAGINYESTPGPMAAAIQSAFPEVKIATRVFMDDMILQSTPGNAAKEEVAYVDSTVFKVFSWKLLRGDASHLFDAPRNVVLTETAAKHYFGNADPLGKTMMINGKTQAAVTGIMQDIPYNSHLRVNMLFSMSTLTDPQSSWNKNWKRFGFYTYLLLKPNTDPAKLSAKFPAFVKANIDVPVKYVLSIEPLKKVYLYGKPRGHRTGASESGSINNIYVFSIVAVFVLFIACFNFINLTTAFSLKRAREVGVRKVLGASKKQLIAQFFIDALLLCLLSFVIALVLAVVLLPVFNRLTNTVIAGSIFNNLKYIGWMLGIAITVGFISGIYPALFLSGFKPISSLKGQFASGAGGTSLRKTLVVAQFAISTVLIISTIVVYKQLDFMQNQQLGFNKAHRLVIDYQFDERIQEHRGLVKQMLGGIPGVNSISYSSGVPGTANNKFQTAIMDTNNEYQDFLSDVYYLDTDFLKQYGISVIAGRGFNKPLASDSNAMLINEAMLAKLNYKTPAEAIGKSFKQLNDQGTIVGVVKDFHYHSSQEVVAPLAIRARTSFFTDLTLDITSAHMQQTVAEIEKRWEQLAPGLPLIYFFADEAYNKQFIAQQQFGNLFVCFSVLAILISCLGLLGLSAFSMAQRRKEIGVRKVLGASTAGIAALLSKDFVKLVFISLLIASPVAWIAMHSWLQGFAYRIQVSWWMFVVSGASALLIALATVSFQSVKAALANPVKSLRSE